MKHEGMGTFFYFSAILMHKDTFGGTLAAKLSTQDGDGLVCPHERRLTG